MFGLNLPSVDNDIKDEKNAPLQPAEVQDPCGFIKDHLHFNYVNDAPGSTRMAAYHGTTCLSFIYDGGIVVAVDSRATGGSFIFSGTVMKILDIAPNMVGTMAGGAADCQYWLRNLSRIYRLHKFRYQQPLTVAAASKILVNNLYQYKGYNLSIGSMICGYDNTGPHIFYVDNDGSRIAGKRFSVGSGSTYALGVLDTDWRSDMTKEEACALGRKAIYHATYRDSGSGGRVTVVHITAAGKEYVSQTDVLDLHDFDHMPE
ncbi:proteasome subunit beta type 5 [Histomonas meleagridis]|uniref:proteasome subunit beta type 5 n=1 Tax=Histomonas meleagridis TaxID=135588 RepID=UPI003559A752|nr:proteasome subunit beta type 5 [Histomonas meleagridis]KAH0803843.1 proteasome subunit beta type 5 [Histomonas meleagridis]